MSEAPERIWAFPTYYADGDGANGPDWTHGNFRTTQPMSGAPYVHEDHSAALVAAAYQAAAKASFQACKAVGTGYKDENERILQRAENEMRLETQKAIRAITPADATAALDALIQKAVLAERERCARVCDRLAEDARLTRDQHRQGSDSWAFNNARYDQFKAIAAAIREGKADE